MLAIIIIIYLKGCSLHINPFFSKDRVGREDYTERNSSHKKTLPAKVNEDAKETSQHRQNKFNIKSCELAICQGI